jgi:hypothetical protein
MGGGLSAAPAPRGDLCQVLFVVDTSRSMSRYSAMTRQTVFDLVYDGVQGQMNSGDIYGIWVFNEKVQTNVFASLNWDAQLNRGLAAGAANFMKTLPYEKQTRLDRLWAELVVYARQTRKLTVIMITDGTDRFVGTPFDAQINTYCEKHSKEFRQAKKPFVITLAALDGKFLACTVNGARDPIAFNSIALQVYEWKQGQPQYQVKESKPAPVVISAVPAVPVIKAEPVVLPANEPTVAVAMQTNTDVPKIDAAPAARIQTPGISAAAATEPAKLVAAPTPSPTNAYAALVATPPPAKPIVDAPIEMAKPENKNVETPTNASTAVVEPVRTEIAPPASVEKQPVPPPKIEERPGELAPVAPQAPVAAVALTPATTATQAATHPQTAPMRVSEKPAPPPGAGNPSPLILIGSAIALFLGASGLVVVMVRRSRKQPTTSFISQSIDRESHL